MQRFLAHAFILGITLLVASWSMVIYQSLNTQQVAPQTQREPAYHDFGESQRQQENTQYATSTYIIYYR